MVAPVATPRVAPTGAKLGDGFKTLITLAANTSIQFWEDSVTPPSLDGGDPIESATMFSTLWRSKSPRKLITMGDVKVEAQYNPVLYSSILAIINVPTTVTIDFPDHSTLAFYGYLRMVDFAALTEGAIGKCTITIVVTNYDYANNVEAAPVYTAPGTPGFGLMDRSSPDYLANTGPAQGSEAGGLAPAGGPGGRVAAARTPVQGGPVFGSPPEVPPNTNYSDYFAEQQRLLEEQMRPVERGVGSGQESSPAPAVPAPQPAPEQATA